MNVNAREEVPEINLQGLRHEDGQLRALPVEPALNLVRRLLQTSLELAGSRADKGQNKGPETIRRNHRRVVTTGKLTGRNNFRLAQSATTRLLAGA